MWAKMYLLLIGILLMTIASPPLDAADSVRTEEVVLTDFTSTDDDFGWYVVNDSVMGGRSEGDFQQEKGELHFTGRTNTNGGGFSSLRTKPMQLDLSSHTGIKLRVKGDGRRYTWRLTTEARFRGRQVSYWAEFDTLDGAWSEVNIPFTSFVPKLRGYQLEGPELDPGQITGMGIMIYDKQDGPFELRLASVRAYLADEPFKLSQYQWKKRVLVLSAPTGDDQHLKQQQHELASAPQEFADRDMALVTLLDNSAATAEDRELTAEEVTTARTALDIPQGKFALKLIGKDGSVKLSSETAIPMAEIYALIDTMPMRRVETAVRE
jgi:monofunctional biosynthetic peptidoglycan transglycosylase